MLDSEENGRYQNFKEKKYILRQQNKYEEVNLREAGRKKRKGISK